MTALPCTLLALALCVLCTPGCATPEGPGSDSPAQSDRGVADRQTAFRVRSGFDAALDADAGWAGDLNADVTLPVEAPFRIRFELEGVASEDAALEGEERRFRLQYRRNGGPWTNLEAQRFPKPERSHTLSLTDDAVGNAPGGWRIVRGNGSDVRVIAGDPPFLRARAGQAALLGIAPSETRWDVTALAAELRLPEASSGAGLIFGYIDPGTYLRVSLDAAGTARLSRIADGVASTLAATPVEIPPQAWVKVGVEMRDRQVTVEVHDETLTATLGAPAPIAASGFYVPAGSAGDVRSFEVEGEPRTPRVSIVATPAYAQGTATADLLTASDASYGGGAGIDLAETTPPLPLGGVQHEWEWPLVIRRFADGAVTNEEGDTFAFRMTYADGRPLPTDALPVITASVPPHLLGGTFAETPGRVGPWEAADGALYFLMEPAETDNVLMVVKSADGGESWHEVDGARRPKTGDLEGFASDTSGGTLHLLHQTSNAVLHHSFRTADHPTRPDTWHVRDDTVATPAEPPTQVASITTRSDGSLVAVYGGPERIHYKIRSPGGTWGAAATIDAEHPFTALSGPMTVRGREDVVHLAYTDLGTSRGTVWYRRILPDGTLTPREKLASGIGTAGGARGAVLPLVYLPEADTVVILYRLASGALWARRVDPHGAITDPARVSSRRVAQNAVDSDQAGADAVGVGGAVDVLFIEEGTGTIYHTRSREAGVWEEATAEVEGITGQWVRGMPLRRGGRTLRVYGYVYDAGSNGGSGMNRYGEVPLAR